MFRQIGSASDAQHFVGAGTDKAVPKRAGSARAQSVLVCRGESNEYWLSR
jgi:hypothetical protein